MPSPRSIQWDQLFRLADDPTLPLQARLRAAIVAAIIDERLRVGAKLPSTRDLAEQLGLSRNTATSAYQQLTDEGFLEARSRLGVYVAARSGAPPNLSEVAACAGPTVDGGGPDWSARVLRSQTGQPTLAKPPNWRQHAYPFVYGQYDAELFPTEEFRECFARSLARAQLPHWTPDFETDDVADLVEQIRCQLLPRRGVFARPEEILVTLGAQHAYYMLAEALFDENTRVGLEEPGHPHARNSFALRRPRLVAMPVDDEGLIVERFPAVDYAFVTPSHQSPTTVTLSLARRHALLAGAAAHEAVVIEDDYEAENLYAGKPLPALKSLDAAGRVIYVGSVAKNLSPALRLGYVVASQPLIQELRLIRHAMLRHPSAYLQHAFALFLSLGHHESHARRVNRVMGERIDVAAAALARHLPECGFTLPQGGASIWVRAPDGIDAVELAETARLRGVLIEAGDVFFLRPPRPCPWFRLRLSSIPATRIADGIAAVALAVKDLSSRAGASARAPGAG